jgi:hypothetical protein
MELACMSGFITPRVVCPGGQYVKPSSGLHVDDLPGFSTASLAAVEPGKYLNAQTFIDEKVRVAGLMMLEQIRAHLETYVIEGRPKESGIIGTFNDDVLPASASKRGVVIRIGGGPMAVIVVPRVFVRCANAVDNVVVYVSDGLTQHSVTVDLQPGVDNEVWLNYESRGKRVEVWIEDDRVQPIGGSAKGTKFFTTCSTCAGHARYKYIAGGGLEGSLELETLRGMSAEVIMTCSIEPVACLLLHRFRWAVLYQFGVLVLEEWLATSRTNYFSIHSKEWAASMLEKWDTVDVKRHMKTHIKTLASYVSQLDPDCLECGTGAQYQEVHG